MRISDWSSDVCSSDLVRRQVVAQAAHSGDELRQRLARQRAPAPGHLAPPVGRVDLPRHVRQVEVALGAQVVHDGSQRAHGAVRTARAGGDALPVARSEEHTSELQSLMRISYAVFCLKKNNNDQDTTT